MSGANLYLAMLLLPLAVSALEWAYIAIAILSFAMNVVVFVRQTVMSGYAKKQDALERKVDLQDARMLESAEALIDAKFAAVRSDVEMSARVLQQAMAEVTRRLEAGDAIFNRLVERDHHNELQIVERVSELKSFVQDACVAKGDFDDFRKDYGIWVRKLSEQLEQMNGRMGQDGGSGRKRYS